MMKGAVRELDKAFRLEERTIDKLSQAIKAGKTKSVGAGKRFAAK